MKVLNIHSRRIKQPLDRVATLVETLASDQDGVWPCENWPAMRLRNGLDVGSTGGHGPIRYTVSKHIPGKLIEFMFRRPKGFDGVHRLEVRPISAAETELVHTIDVKLGVSGILSWALAVRPLHDALIEDALDKVQNSFGGRQRRSNWSLWVKVLRKIFKRGTNIKRSSFL